MDINKHKITKINTGEFYESITMTPKLTRANDKD